MYFLNKCCRIFCLFMCGVDAGRRYEEVDMPWSGSMGVVMEEPIWIDVF
jgi:hypothetical protein